jgi:hypothetical protein
MIPCGDTLVAEHCSSANSKNGRIHILCPPPPPNKILKLST